MMLIMIIKLMMKKNMMMIICCCCWCYYYYYYYYYYCGGGGCCCLNIYIFGSDITRLKRYIHKFMKFFSENSPDFYSGYPGAGYEDLLPCQRPEMPLRIPVLPHQGRVTPTMSMEPMHHGGK